MNFNTAQKPNCLSFHGKFQLNAAKARSPQAVMIAAVIGQQAGPDGKVASDGCGGTMITVPDNKDMVVIGELQKRENYFPDWREIVDANCKDETGKYLDLYDC